MKKLSNIKGIILPELVMIMFVVANIAAIGSISTSSYDGIEKRADRASALSNARIIIASVSAHNAMAEADDTIVPIFFEAGEDAGIILLNGTDGLAIDSIEAFNTACEIDLSGMSDVEYKTALEYIILVGDNKINLDEEYDHTAKK